MHLSIYGIAGLVLALAWLIAAVSGIRLIILAKAEMFDDAMAQVPDLINPRQN